jgi:hypothetical protein
VLEGVSLVQVKHHVVPVFLAVPGWVHLKAVFAPQAILKSMLMTAQNVHLNANSARTQQ